MHRAVPLALGIGSVVLSELLGYVYGDGIDNGADAGLVKPVPLRPLRHRVWVEQAIGSDLRLVALDVGLHLIRIS